MQNKPFNYATTTDAHLGGAMKYRLRNVWIAVCASVFLLGWNALPAQTAMSLDDAVQAALRKNLQLEIVRNDMTARQIQNSYGMAGGLPTVSATANDQAQVTDIYQKLSTGTEIKRNGALGNNLTASVNGTMVLYNGLRIQATKDRLELLAHQSEQLLAATIQNTIAEVMTQYHEVYLQTAMLAMIEVSGEVARNKLMIVEARQAAGYANDADLFQAQVDVNAFRQQRAAQEIAILQAKADLLNLIQDDPWKPITLTDSIVVDTTLAFDSLLTFLQLHPLYLAAEQEVKAQALLEQEVAAQRKPTLRANAGYNFGNNVSTGGFNLVSRNYGPYAGLNLSVPIYNGNTSKRQSEVAALNTRNAVLEKDLVMDQQTAGLFKAWQNYQSALSLLRYERQNFQLSQRLLLLMQQKFTLRSATILELKDAQKSYEESGYRLVNLQFAAKASEIELLRLSGQLQ